MIDVVVGPLIQVVLPDEDERTFPASDLEGLDLASASDAEVINAALYHIERDAGRYPNLTVTRPRTGNVVISPKAVFGI